MEHLTISSIDLIDDHITIVFKNHWFQEDIHTLRQILLEQIPNHQIKETTLGADRESIRLLWLDAELMLNFDYYSQSCWFSAHNEMSTSKILPLFTALSKNLEHHV